MEKILPVLLTAILALAGLTGIGQAQNEPSTDEIVEVDIMENPDEFENLEQNVENMLKLLDDLQSDGGLSKELTVTDPRKVTEQKKVTEQGNDDMKASIPQDPSIEPDKNLNPIPPPVVQKAIKNRIEPANEVVKFVPIDPDSLFRRGMDFWRSKNPEAAIKHFEEVVRLDPNNAHAYWNLGLLYEAKNRGSDALNNVKKAQAIYLKYDYSLYVAQAKKRLEHLSKKYNDQ